MPGPRAGQGRRGGSERGGGEGVPGGGVGGEVRQGGSPLGEVLGALPGEDRPEPGAVPGRRGSGGVRGLEGGLPRLDLGGEVVLHGDEYDQAYEHALAIARALGARTIVTSSSDAKLERAREQALSVVRDAEHLAAARVEETKRRLPAIIEEKRQSARTAFEKEAGALGSEASDTVTRLESAITRGREAAISLIVDKVIS